MIGRLRKALIKYCKVNSKENGKGRKTPKTFFADFQSFDLDLVCSRLIYEKVSILTGLQAQKTHMAISDDLTPLGLPEGQ